MLATVPSQTSAARLKKMLAEKGIKSGITQTPSVLTKEGCGYSLRFENKYRSLVENGAKELKITVRAFFEEKDGGYIKR